MSSRHEFSANPSRLRGVASSELPGHHSRHASLVAVFLLSKEKDCHIPSREGARQASMLPTTSPGALTCSKLYHQDQGFRYPPQFLALLPISSHLPDHKLCNNEQGSCIPSHTAAARGEPACWLVRFLNPLFLGPDRSDLTARLGFAYFTVRSLNPRKSTVSSNRVFVCFSW